MKANVGSSDRVRRAELGLALLGLTLTGTVGPWGRIGLVPMATAGIGFCPVYAVLGVSSCPVKR